MLHGLLMVSANRLNTSMKARKATHERKIFSMSKLTAQSNRHLAAADGLRLLLIVALLVLPASGWTYNRETAVVKAVRTISPAVVNISSEYEVRQRTHPFGGFGLHPFFDSFFDDFFDSGIERRAKRTSLGSGVIIDGQRGFILTNAHVIASTAMITVALQDEREFEAQIVGVDPESDLAVLRIPADEPLPAVAMGDSRDIMIGETVIAIGNPFGFSHTVTTGVVSATNRSIRSEDRLFQDFIQLDASINPGNSGGPLLNINGDLIGINTAIYAKAQGIGFAIPINKAKRIVNDLIRYGEVIQAWIGAVIQELDAELAAYLKVPGARGVLVQAIESKSPAQAAGLKAGDIILTLGDRPVPSRQAYEKLVKNYAAGETLTMKLWRNAKNVSVKVKTKVFPEERALDLAWQKLGAAVAEIDRTLRRQYRIEAREGLVITELHPQSYLAEIGVVPGDVIRRIADDAVTNIATFKKAIVKYRKESSLVLLIQRGFHGYYIAVEMP